MAADPHSPKIGALPGLATPAADQAPIRGLIQGLDWAHPIVREFFLERIASPTEPQELGWPHILAQRTTVTSAPTGSPKTLAAFLSRIDRPLLHTLTDPLH